MDILLSAVDHAHSTCDVPSHHHSAHNVSGPPHNHRNTSPSQHHSNKGPSQCQDSENTQKGDQEEPIDGLARAPTAKEATLKLWTETPQPSGRQAKDPYTHCLRFDCKDVDDLETKLAEYLLAPAALAEHATIEFHFPATAAFMVCTRDFERDASTAWAAFDVPDLTGRTSVSVAEVLQDTANLEDEIVRQKAVARAIVEAVQRVDGFRYCFHNDWLSREDRAHHFSLFCSDSTLSKDRAANGGAGSDGSERRKPVHDCRIFVTIKFSITKDNLEVHYRHVPLHETSEERASPPRRESKRRRLREVLDPQAVERLLKKPKKSEGTLKDKQNCEMFEPDEKTAKSGSTNNQSRPVTFEQNMHRPPPTDEGLRSPVDFLGSAKRQTPIRVVNQPSQVANSNDDENDTRILADGNTEYHSTSAPLAIPREKGPDNYWPARKRPKIDGPMLPGQMEGYWKAEILQWVSMFRLTTTSKLRRKKGGRGSKQKQPRTAIRTKNLSG